MRESASEVSACTIPSPKRRRCMTMMSNPMTALPDGRWLVRRPGPAPQLRLYCFCCAGGNAMTYLPWQALFDPSIDICAIQLPGRAGRWHDPPYSCLPALIEELAPIIRRDAQVPFAFFGHSLGSLIAFDMARHFQSNGWSMPRHLFVAGCAAPQLREASRRVHELPDDELIEVLREYKGTPAAVLGHRELVELILPAIRADFGMAADYTYLAGAPLRLPISVLTGKLDNRVSLAQAEGWRRETVGTFNVHIFEGDHFFIHPEARAVADTILKELGSIR